MSRQSPVILLYGSALCPHCVHAKERLKANNYRYESVDVRELTPEQVQQLRVLSNGKRTVPQIFVGKDHIGGNDDLEEADRTGALSDKVAAAHAESSPFWTEFPFPDTEHKDESDVPQRPPSAEEERQRMLWETARSVARRLERQAEGGTSAWWGLKQEPWTVTPAAAVMSLQEERGCSRREAAQLLGEMFRLGLVFVPSSECGSIDTCSRLRFQAHESSATGTPAVEDGEGVSCSRPRCPTPRERARRFRREPEPHHRPLNCGVVYDGPPRSATWLACTLYERFLDILQAHGSADGRAVDYDGMARSPLWPSCLRAAAMLQTVDMGALGPNARLGFLLNLYNVMVIHGTIAVGEPAGLMDRLSFYNRVQYRLGPWVCSLNDIEHGLLRQNKKAPGSLRRPFGSKDPRRAWLGPGDADPRIHFALVCGAKGCPAIRVFHPDTVDDALDDAAHTFCNDDRNLQIREETRTVLLSKIFCWYGEDFGNSPKEVLEWCLPWLEEPKHSALRRLLDQDSAPVEETLPVERLQRMLGKGRLRVSYLPYNWELNTAS